MDMELKLFHHLNRQIKNLCTRLPNTIDIISSKISCMKHYFDLDSKTGDSVVKYLFDYGIINAHLCKNAETGINHTENDGSYTIISVPVQPHKQWKRVRTEFHFNIQPNDIIAIPMVECVSFMFSGYMLSHNQIIRNKDKVPKDIFLINIATYANKRLCDNMLKSFKRTMNL